SSAAGVVKEVLVKVGDKVSQGTVMIKVESAGASAGAVVGSPPVQGEGQGGDGVQPASGKTHPPPSLPLEGGGAKPAAAAPAAAPSAVKLGGKVHASPSVRAYARELGVDLAQVKATGPKNRILKEDVTAFVKGAMTSGVVPGKTPASASGGGGGLDLLPWPKVDFAKYGEVDVQPM